MMNMRASQGMPHSRNVLLYNPDLFREHEEVIIFRREDFQCTYNSIREHIEDINQLDMEIERDKGWKLLGYWPVIMEKIQLIELNMNLIFEEKPTQTYLDAYLYNTSEGLSGELLESRGKVPGESHIPHKPIKI